jgi:L-rhamnose mutarotase
MPAFRVNRKSFLATVIGAIIVLSGCEGQFGQRGPAQREARPVAEAGMKDPALTTPQESGNRKRYCSLYLLNTTIEEPGAAKDKELAGPKTATEQNSGGETKKEKSSDSGLPLTVQKYKRLHDEIPADVVAAMTQHNVRNYSVQVGLVSGEYYVVRYFEYVGSSPEVDLTLLAREPAFRKWQEACDACQLVLLPMSGASLGPFMEEIYHNDLRPSGQAKPPVSAAQPAKSQ